MTPLSYITRGNSSPRGKARVYFCCHPDDQSAFLKPVADQILALQNCAVWYYPEPGAPLSPDRREELAQMQLFVVPVTSRFLTDPSPALSEEFTLALEQRQAINAPRHLVDASRICLQMAEQRLQASA